MEGRKSGETLHYVGKILSDQEEHFQISFLRMKPGTMLKDKFQYPETVDITEVEKERVLVVLSVSTGTTQRQAGIFKIFPPLSNFNMR